VLSRGSYRAFLGQADSRQQGSADRTFRALRVEPDPVPALHVKIVREGGQHTLQSASCFFSLFVMDVFCSDLAMGDFLEKTRNVTRKKFHRFDALIDCLDITTYKTQRLLKGSLWEPHIATEVNIP
jgi:hypothetical protein